MKIAGCSRLFKEKNLSELNVLLESAECKITFWGHRVISVKGYGNLLIDESVQRVHQVARRRFVQDNLTTSERVAGIEITERLKNFYRISDHMLAHSNWFTKLLGLIRKVTFRMDTARFYIEDHLTQNYFCAYSEFDFIANFGDYKGADGKYLNSDGNIGRKIFAKPELISEQLALEKEAVVDEI